MTAFSERAQNHLSRISLNQPLNQVNDYLDSNETNEFMQQTPQMLLTTAKILMSNQQYPLAIIFLEVAIMTTRGPHNVQFDPLLKSNCYQAMGDCYRKMKVNEKALENYTLALDANIVLPAIQRCQILYAAGKVLVEMNQWQTALQNYIRAAEIYQTEVPDANADGLAVIEDCIEQVTSHILASNE